MNITLTFHGSAGTVTGSCYRLDAGKKSLLIDCGMFQGDKTLKQLNYDAWPFDPRGIDAVLMTHAHIDHSGLIPKLTRAGYKGPVIATEGTAELLRFMLPDSGSIQEMEVERLNRRNQRRGLPPLRPIYTQQNAKDALEQIEPGMPVLIDCLTLWLSNHMLAENDVEAECERLLEIFSRPRGPWVAVSNEVGLGIVPDNALGRRFRDAQGRLNQMVASGADDVLLLVAGIPMKVK